MSQNTSPDNVPSATKGTADSLAAPGRVGAGDTSSKPRYQFRKSVGLLACHGDELKAIAKQESRSVESVMRSLIVLGLVLRREKEQRA